MARPARLSVYPLEEREVGRSGQQEAPRRSFLVDYALDGRQQLGAFLCFVDRDGRWSRQERLGVLAGGDPLAHC
jgi:hypothetical protein